jgi:hypothetical protein
MSIDTGVRVSPLTWLRDQLSRYTYRPGWTLEIGPEPGPVSSMSSAGRLVISFRETDSRDPSRTTRVRSTNVIPIPVAEMFDEAIFADWLQRTLFVVEMHESREWLRRDGQIYDDPHA